MILLKTEMIKDVCSDISQAVDSNGLLDVTEVLQIELINKQLSLSVTNGEYYVKYKLDVDTTEELKAVVNASTFLKLISKLTTDEISLEIVGTNLIVEANGNYKFPLVYKDDSLLEVKEIVIDNPTTTFSVKSNVLKSILDYNTGELNKGILTNPVQKLYYVDNEGAITFTTGACVNSFTLPSPVKLLLNKRLVKLFKLFDEEDVSFTLGQDDVNGVTVTKVRFETTTMTLVSLLNSNDTLINSVPASAIRSRANTVYDYGVVVSKSNLLSAIDRLSLFIDSMVSQVIKLHFTSQGVQLSDIDVKNVEKIQYEGSSNVVDDYEMVLNLQDLKTTVSLHDDSYITFAFGNHQAVVINKDNVYVIIPEVIV